MKKRISVKEVWDMTSGAASIGIIGGADGPTAVFIASKLPIGIVIGAAVMAVLLVGAVVLALSGKGRK